MSASSSSSAPWSIHPSGFSFEWNFHTDAAQLRRASDQKIIWRGPLLPGFWLLDSTGTKRFLKAKVRETQTEATGGLLHFSLGDLGQGSLRFRATAAGVEFTELKVTWSQEVPRLISLYFGVGDLDPVGWSAVPRRDEPFWPQWQTDGFCIPSAKGAPIQSFFRFWDFGHAHMALGSFGPTGTPYAAAYPRPLYCAAMGGEAGWLTVGPGAIPDGALYLKISSGASCLHLLYREDLWGAPAGNERTWAEPLRLSWAEEAWDAYRVHFSTFPTEPVSAHHQRSSWNSWSEYRSKIFENKPLVEAIAREIRAELFTFDEGWESGSSTGNLNLKKFPNLTGDFEATRKNGLGVGLWQSVSWVEFPEEVGLTKDDLLCGLDGTPIRANWLCSPFTEPSRPALDPSSPATRAFIRNKTHKLVREYGAQLLKMDFGYGLPGPDAAAPRDPALRGERFAFTLYHLMAEAAREINPDITLQCWGLSPLLRPAFNLLALDDLGDAGPQEALGHRQWSVWAALAGGAGTAIMASSGYDWDQDPEILLNTAVIGSPSGLLSINEKAGGAPRRGLAQRRALSLWYRRTVSWQPLWLNTEKGRLGHDPLAKCWGRLEPGTGGTRLTALALRDGADKLSDRSSLRQADWTGRWAVLAQGDHDVYEAPVLACIPFDTGVLSWPCAQKPREVKKVVGFAESAAVGWTWQKGFLTLPANDLEPDFTGFLVLR